MLIEKRVADRFQPVAIPTKSAYPDSIGPAEAGLVCVAPNFQSVGNFPNRDTPLFTLEALVMEYATNLLIIKVCEEIETRKITLLNSHVLVKVQAKYSVRDTQRCLILKPVQDKLLNSLRGKSNLENQIR